MWTFQTLTISTGKCKEQDSRSDLIGSALKSIEVNRITVHKFGTGWVPWRAVAEEISRLEHDTIFSVSVRLVIG